VKHYRKSLNNYLGDTILERRNSKEHKGFIRVNFNIKVLNVRVIQDGEQLGIMPTEKARKLAMDNGLDLVETVPNANPPVCQIIEFSKFRFQQIQKEKELAKKQRESFIETKEIRLRPNIQENDIETKTNAAKRFLSDGKKVLFILEYKNREIAHKDEGFKVINKVIVALEDMSTIAMPPKIEGKRLMCRLEPKLGVNPCPVT
jgi:translation initiation factor IF-3